MAVDASRPIALLAPTTVSSASEDASVVLEMTGDAFRALRDAVEVAFEDPPDDYARRDLAAHWWEFVHPPADAEAAS